MQGEVGLSQRRACGMVALYRATCWYRRRRCEDPAASAFARVGRGEARFRYRRPQILLEREGWQVNAKRIYRLYLEEGLIVRTQKRRERAH